jgi:electron transport complex protein RnfG
MKNDFIMPVLVLTLICLIISGALALVNDLTHPIIEEAANERAEIARKEIIPEAEEFILIEAEGAPKAVREIYGTSNNTGYIFVVVTNKGYGGDIKIICGIDPDGKIIKSAVLAHTETQGLGTIVFERAVIFEGLNKNVAAEIDALAGSTITSTAYKNAILDAFEAFEIVREEQS